MENLNNENTWDELRIQFPSATRQLSIFIEDYKSKINWLHLFNPKFESVHVSGHGFTKLTNDRYPNFEELPFHLQMGVIIAFFSKFELLSDKMGRRCQSIQLFKLYLHDRLGMLEEILNRKIG